MCLEKQTISAALGDDTSATLDVDRPILRVDDPRLDADDPMMQRRRKVPAVLGKNFPMTIALADVEAHGLVAPYEQGKYKAMKGADGSQNSCAPVNAYIMSVVGASEVWGFGIEWGGWGTKAEGFKPKRSTPQPGYVSYAPGRLPSVGDIFILYEQIAPGVIGAGHCGVVCQASLGPDEFWITGDGGQPDRTGDLHQRADGRFMRSYNNPDPDYPPDAVGELVPGTNVTWRIKAHEAAYLVPRKLDCSDPKKPLIANYFTGGGGETLHGWRNVTHPKINFKNGGAYDESGSKQDYEDFKAKILNVDKLAKAEIKLRADMALLGY